ncbi:MAG: tetratricopeptide repeat protein, partial [Bacteroidetes bacterium]|nr:tetratricopeptide repeat protein [Bacteroidota bacterium]
LYYQKAIDLYLKTKNRKELAGVLINQGIVYTYIGKNNEAEKNYLQALTIYQEEHNIPGLSPTYNSLAKIYFAKKDYEKAIEYYKQSEKYSIESNNSFNLISTYNSLAIVYKELKKYNEAKIYSEKSIAISKQIGALEREMFCHETMGDILFSMGDYKNAYESFKNYSVIKDSIFTSDKNDAIAEMQAKFDVEKNQQKVKEIELQKKLDADSYFKRQLILVIILVIILISLGFTIILFRNKRKINTLLEQKNIAIQANLEQKEVMMGEIHHRVKNNLQMVSSILDLQARELKDPGSLRVIEDSLNRISAISLIHQRLYQTENIRGIKIDSYLKELCHDLIQNFASKINAAIILKYNIEDVVLDLETAIPVGLISAELVTNACKYAFEGIQNPSIIIGLNIENKKMILRVKDNGIGKSSHQINQTSFGTKLIKSLSRKLKADIQENISNGTEVILTINQFKIYES